MMMEDKSWDEKYSPKDYSKTVYSFKPQEIAKLAPWDAQVQLGNVAQNVLSNILSKECLKRVGVKNSKDTAIRYDIHTEQFFVYQPRIWCSLCTTRKAEYSVKDKVYCGDCIEILKAQAKKEVKPKEEVKTESK